MALYLYFWYLRMKLYVLFDIMAGHLQSIKLSCDIFMHRGQAGHAMSACISCPPSNNALIILLDLNNCGKIYSILTFIWHVSKTKICISRKSSPQYRGEEGVQSQMGLHSKVWGWIIQMTSNYLNKFCSNLNKEISLLRFETLAMLYICT